MGFTDYDSDAEIEVFYNKASNFDACKNLSSGNRPIIYVYGTYKAYSNSNNGGYLERVTAALLADYGLKLNHKKVYRLMSQNGLLILTNL